VIDENYACAYNGRGIPLNEPQKNSLRHSESIHGESQESYRFRRIYRERNLRQR